MLIFWKERLVFMANTKTGSTSIEAALEPLAHVAIRRPPQLKHTNARGFERHFRPLLESKSGGSFTTVALMREPIDWIGSWFRYRQREDTADAAQSTAGLDFAQYVEAYLSEAPPPYAAVGTQCGFLCDKSGQPGIDRIFKYEELDRFVHFLEDILGCEITLPRMNVSPRAPMNLPSGLRARLEQRLAADYALYRSLH